MTEPASQSTSKTRTLETPSAGTAVEFLQTALDDGRMLTLFGYCEVEYDGRASSYLGPGDRLIVLKPDGTLLVHTDEQRTPVNWQPPGCVHSAETEGETAIVRSLRDSPTEEITVRFDVLHQISSFAVTDSEALELEGTEADLRDRIIDDPALLEDGFEPKETEWQTGRGNVDIYGTDVDGRHVVVELKRRRVGPKAASQLRRYVDAVRRREDEPVRGILVAPSITDSTETLLAEEELEYVSLEPMA